MLLLTAAIVLLVLGSQLFALYQRKARLARADPSRWRRQPSDYSEINFRDEFAPPNGFLETLFYDMGPEVVPIHTIEYRSPKRGTQQYTVVNIDTGGLTEGDFLIVRVAIGANSGASIDLFDGDVDLNVNPSLQEEARRSTHLITNAYNVSQGEAVMLYCKLNSGDKYQLGVTGTWNDAYGMKNHAVVAVHAATLAETSADSEVD